MLPVVPVFYLLAPNLYVLCCFPQIPISDSYTVCPFLPYLVSRAAQQSLRVPVCGPWALQGIQPVSVRFFCRVTRPQARAAARSGPGSQSRVGRTCGDPDGGIRDQRALASGTCIKGKPVPWPSNSLSPSGQAGRPRRRKGSRQAPHLSFLLGTQVDKLAALFTAFFPFPFVLEELLIGSMLLQPWLVINRIKADFFKRTGWGNDSTKLQGC